MIHVNFKEFLTRLNACAADCNFICPFDDSHELTEYHIVNRIRSGVLDKYLQQEMPVKLFKISANSIQ